MKSVWTPKRLSCCDRSWTVRPYRRLPATTRPSPPREVGPFHPGQAVAEAAGVGVAVAGVDVAGLGAVGDAVEDVEVGQGVDGRLVERRHQRRGGAEVGGGRLGHRTTLAA